MNDECIIFILMCMRNCLDNESCGSENLNIKGEAAENSPDNELMNSIPPFLSLCERSAAACILPSGIIVFLLSVTPELTSYSLTHTH